MICPYKGGAMTSINLSEPHINISVYFLRFIAILLIVNSHMAPLYPDARLAFGGHLGNSIFFFASGFGLLLSHAYKPLGIATWYRKRFLKLFIPAIFFFFLVNIANPSQFVHDIYMNLVPHSPDQAMRFLPNIVLLYFIFPLTMNSPRTRLALLTIALCTPFILVAFSNHYALDTNSSSDMLYCCNALCMFTLGAIFANISKNNTYFVALPYLVIIFLFVFGIHITLAHFLPYAKFYNYYVNIIIIVTLYLIFSRMHNIKSLYRYKDYFKYAASTSLAVYIIHFSILQFAKQNIGQSFISVAFVFLSSLLISIPATFVSNKIVGILKL